MKVNGEKKFAQYSAHHLIPGNGRLNDRLESVTLRLKSYLVNTISLQNGV